MKFTTPIRFAALLAGCLLAGPALQAITVAYEGFDMPPGELDNLEGETSFGWGWLIPNILPAYWYAYDLSTADTYHAVSDGGLEYDGVPFIGNAFEFTEEVVNESNNNWAYRKLAKFYNYSSSGQLWWSVLVNPQWQGDQAGWGYFQVCLSLFHNAVYMGLSNADDQTVWSGGGERLYVDGINGEKWAYSEVPVEQGVTAFLVMHLDFDNKTAHFYVNPDPYATEPEPNTLVANFEMLTDMEFDRVMMWSVNNGPSVDGAGADYFGTLVDEIRLGTTYASVANGADLTDPGTGGGDTTPPIIKGPTGEAGDAEISVTINEKTVRVGNMTANETVAWSISGGVDGALFTIGSSGGLSFKDFPDYEAPLDADTNNVYIVVVQARDEYSNASTQTINVTVADVDDEIAPTITGLTGDPGAAESTAEINENLLIVGTYTADEEVVWDLSGGTDELLFQIGGETGELRFIEAPDFEAPGDTDTNNVYEVEVRATDPYNNVSVQLVQVTVLDVVNESGDTEPPVITGVSGSAGDPASATTVPEMSLDAGVLSANEDVTWSISGGVDAAWFSISSGGALAFAIRPDFELPADVDANNVYVVEITATDGFSNSAVHTVSVTVTDVAAWAGHTGDGNGWVDTDVNGTVFMGYLNITHEPYMYSAALGRYLFIPETLVTDDGAYAYAPLDLSLTTPLDWSFWAASAGWVDTGSEFIGPLNIEDAPWVFSPALDNFLHLPAEQVTATGAWFYTIVR